MREEAEAEEAEAEEADAEQADAEQADAEEAEVEEVEAGKPRRKNQRRRGDERSGEKPRDGGKGEATVTKKIDCQVFEDQLDALVRGDLPEEGMRQLRLHAASCPDCAMLLKVQDHLTSPSLRELEEAVPNGLVENLWENIEAGLASSLAREARRSSSITPFPKPFAEEPSGTGLPGVSAETSVPLSTETSVPPSPPRFGWLMPALAAATVVLLLSTGFLFSELRRTEARGVRLTEQVIDLQLEMTELDARTEWVERTAQLAGRGRNPARALDHLLAGQESVTVGALLRLLEDLPSDLVLFETSRLERLLSPAQRPPPELRDLLFLLADDLGEMSGTQRVLASDLARWLSAAGLPPDMQVPKAPLIDLLS